MTLTQNHANELYKTQKGVSWQCDLTDKVYLQFGEIITAFKVQDFFIFRRKVNSVDIHEMIFNLSDDYDFELIESPKNGFSHQLTLCEIVQLRDLLDGTKFSLDMNTMLFEVLGSFAVV